MTSVDGKEHTMPGRRKVDPEYPSIAADLTRRGKTAQQIADQLGVTTRTVQRYRVKTGVSKHVPKIELSDEQWRFVDYLIHDECPVSEIARTMGCRPELIIRRYPPDRYHRKPNPVGYHYQCIAKSLGVW